MGEIQPSRERLVEIGVREGTHLLLEVSHLLLPESRPKFVDHQGYKLAFLGFAISHLRLLESFRRPSLQRIPGAVGLRPEPGAEISASLEAPALPAPRALVEYPHSLYLSLHASIIYA